jgi:uncharacterized protein (TIRG00374 family)
MEDDVANTPQPGQPPSIILSRRSMVLMVLLVALILFFFVRLIDFRAVGETLQTADWRYLSLASAMLLLGMLAFAQRWRRLMNNRPPLPLTFHACNVGHAGNIIIPARGGELLRILILGQSRYVSYAQATSTFALERIVELLMRYLTLILAVFFGAGLSFNLATMLLSVAGLAAVLLLILWLIRYPDLALERIPPQLGRLPLISEAAAHRWVSEALDSLRGLSSPTTLLAVIGWSLLTWFFWGACFYCTLLALGDAFPASSYLGLTFAAATLSPPSAPTQPGIFHASIVLPLAALGFDEVALTAFAIAIQALEMVWMFGFGLLGLLRSGASIGRFVTVR